MNTSINENIKFDFQQIQKGLISFISDLEKKLQFIVPELPVFVIQTGDGSYFLDKKFEDIDNKEIYQKIPRFIINFEDFEIVQDDMTNKFNKLIYKYSEKIYECKFRRLPLNFTINTDFVSSNFVKMLENFTVLTSITLNPNPFTYVFMGSIYEGAYTIQSNSIDKPSMDTSSATRNFSVKTSLTLQLHIVSPEIASIKEHVSTEKVVFDLNERADDKSIELTENLEITKQ